MEAGVNRLGEAGCRYTKEYVWKISGQYIHFHRSYDSFCKVRTFVLIYRPHPVYYKTIDRILKIVPLVAFPVNSYCWSKSAEHDVTLTSFMTDSTCVELIPEEAPQILKRNSQYFRIYLRKTTVGIKMTSH